MDRLLAATARAETSHFWWRGFRAFVRPALRRAASGGRARLLDCGCGTGGNLRLLREIGSAIGVDLRWAGLAFALDRGERRVAQATAAALPFPDACFDLVASFDMVQSVPDTDEPRVFAELHRVLRPGGHLVLTTAAMKILWGSHSVLAHDLRRYSRRELRERLTAAGFEPVRVTYTNASLFPILAPLRAAQRAIGLAASDLDAKAEREIAIPPAPINAALTALLHAEALLLRAIDMPFGSSLLAIARKGSGLEKPI